jgi:hypothetical protein
MVLQGRNLDYVVEVEVFLAKVFNFMNEENDDEDLPCVLSSRQKCVLIV